MESDQLQKGGLDGGDSSTFEALERDFQEVLSELIGDKSLERFRVEYEKLHNALRKSHDQEKKLIKKCRELNSEIVNNAAKVQTALKLSQEDQTTIGSLKKEIEKAWKMVDGSHEKELRAKETIQHLKDEIMNLSRLVEQGAGLNIGQENMVKDLLKVKEELSRVNEEQETRIKNDKVHILELQGNVQNLEQQVSTYKTDTQHLKDQLALKKADQEREARRKEKFDKEIKDLRVKYEKKALEQTTLSIEFNRAQSNISHLEKQLSEARGTSEKYLRDYDNLYNRTQKLTELLNEQNDRNMQFEVERHEFENEIKGKQDEINRLKIEKATTERRIEKEKKNVNKWQQKVEVEKTKQDEYQTEIKSMQRDIDRDKKIEEHQKHELEVLERDRQIQLRNVQRAEDKTRDALDNVLLNERIAKSLEAELNGFKLEAAKQRKLIYQLEKEREKYGMEATEQRNFYLNALEDMKLKDLSINEMQKKVSEGETKLKQQQQLYEAVRSDRNLYSKNLIESQDEIAEMKRKFKIMNHQIEQLKEEITAKDHALVREHSDFQKVEKQREHHKNELAKLKKMMETHEKTIDNQESEIKKMTSMLKKMDDDTIERTKEYDRVTNERDVLGTQLIRRNDELALLYEKIKIQQSTLRKGESQFQERIQDIRILRLKIGDLKREIHIAKHQAGQLDDLKREVCYLQKEVLQEKTKVKALSEELENPMNVHRWRKLEGSDPATYEMIQKIQTLQKRLIHKTEEVVEKELIIQEKEKLYVELKSILARQPGPEVAEQLSIYQQNLKDKTRQMKGMASELNMYQAQTNEYKYEIERLTREIQDVKRRYYQKKMKEKLPISNISTPTEMQHSIAAAAQTKFVGGGFNLQSNT